MKNPLKGASKKAVKEAVTGSMSRSNREAIGLTELGAEMGFYTKEEAAKNRAFYSMAPHTELVELNADYLIGKMDVRTYLERSMTMAMERTFDATVKTKPKDEEDAVALQCLKSNYQIHVGNALRTLTTKEFVEREKKRSERQRKIVARAIALGKKYKTPVMAIYNLDERYKELITGMFTREEYAAILEETVSEMRGHADTITSIDCTSIVTNTVSGTVTCAAKNGLVDEEEAKEYVEELQDNKEFKTDMKNATQEIIEKVEKKVKLMREYNQRLLAEIYD